MTSARLRSFILKRLGGMVVVLAVMSFLLFALQRVVPGDPARANLGRGASVEQVEAERVRLGYDDPVIVQYVHYLGDLLHGDLQSSINSKRPVVTDLAEYIPASAELFLAGLGLAILGGLVLGVVSARRGLGATLLRGWMVAAASAPVFLLGLAAILLFYRQLGWLPSSGRTGVGDAPTGPTRSLVIDGILAGRLDVTVDALQHLLLPALCLAIGPAVGIGRVLRSALVSAMRADYIRTARAKGMTERRITIRHALRNCLNGALAMTGLQVGIVFAGMAVVEQVFSWPGLGAYVNRSIAAADLPAIMGFALVGGALYVVANALVDILQAVADPRLANSAA